MDPADWEGLNTLQFRAKASLSHSVFTVMRKPCNNAKVNIYAKNFILKSGQKHNFWRTYSYQEVSNWTFKLRTHCLFQETVLMLNVLQYLSVSRLTGINLPILWNHAKHAENNSTDPSLSSHRTKRHSCV